MNHPVATSRSRRPRFEPLESRHVLAAVVVTNNLDTVNGDVTNVAALLAAGGDGGDGISIREAIEATNNTPGADDITFDFGVDGPVTILLTEGELQITDSLSITGDGAELLTIDAGQMSRLLHVEGTDGEELHSDLAVNRMTLRNGNIEFLGTQTREELAILPYAGGAIRFFSTGMLTLDELSILENSTSGEFQPGGAVFSLNGDMRIHSTSFIGNSTSGLASSGGAILSVYGQVAVVDSLFQNNRASGSGSEGGCMRSVGQLNIENSTLSNNYSNGNGGCLSHYGSATLLNTTLTDNRSLGRGGGIDNLEKYLGAELTIRNSIIAGNWAAADPHRQDLNVATSNIDYSVIGVTPSNVDESTGVGNLLNVDPLLGPLADNGGPTLTHALLPGSPAIDAGDPAIQFDPDEFDQRGPGFFRVADGNFPDDIVIDIGAYESQSIPIDFPLGDYNHDGIADSGDYVLWRDTLGSQVETGTGADGVADGVIDSLDYDFWRSHFGNTQVVFDSPAAVEAAFAGYLSPAAESDDDEVVAGEVDSGGGGALQVELLLASETPREDASDTRNGDGVKSPASPWGGVASEGLALFDLDSGGQKPGS